MRPLPPSQLRCSMPNGDSSSSRLHSSRALSMKVCSCDCGANGYHYKGAAHARLRETTAHRHCGELSDVSVVFSSGSLSFEGERPTRLDLHVQADHESHRQM